MIKNLLLQLFPAYRVLYGSVSTFLIKFYMLKLKHVLRSLGSNSRIFFANIVEPYNVSIGHHVYINKNCDLITTGSRINIGNYVMVGPNTTMVAQNHVVSDWSKPMIFNKNYIRKNIVIEDDVWIGANVTILAGVTIKRGSVIGAGSVVTKDVEPYSIYAGIPAKKIRDRLQEHDKKQAENIDLSNFENIPMNWNSWGVGNIIK
jgi:acetyltransferase-like isoleucine patch superfamily enzyme